MSVAAVCTIALVAAGCGDNDDDDGADAAFESHEITLVQPTDMPATIVDEGDPGASAGDTRAFAFPLFEPGTETEVAQLRGTATVVDIGELDGQEVEFRSSLVHITFDDASLVTVGVYTAPGREVRVSDKPVERPIVGGTGKYKGASGQITQRLNDDGDIDTILEFDTPKREDD